MQRQMLGVYLVKLIYDKSVGEEDRIEEERLTHHERQSQQRSLAVLVPHVPEDFFPGCVIPDPELEPFPFGFR